MYEDALEVQRREYAENLRVAADTLGLSNGFPELIFLPPNSWENETLYPVWLLRGGQRRAYFSNNPEADRLCRRNGSVYTVFLVPSLTSPNGADSVSVGTQFLAWSRVIRAAMEEKFRI